MSILFIPLPVVHKNPDNLHPVHYWLSTLPQQQMRRLMPLTILQQHHFLNVRSLPSAMQKLH
jgi:hypothetical protein